MKLFIIVRDDVTIANGVTFAPGATVVHSLLRRDRDSLTRFTSMSEVRQAYRGCKIEVVDTSRDATYSYVVRKVSGKRAPARKATKRRV